MPVYHVNGKASREIDWAIDEIAAGNIRQGLKRLCDLRGKPLPEIKTPKKRTVRVTLPPPPDGATGWKLLVPQDSRRIAPLPKSRKRIVDRKALKAYRATSELCELVRCCEPPCPEPHHLISRKMKGDDVPSNLLNLCARHHREWHISGPLTWTQKYLHDLTAESRSKVMAALRMGEE